MQRAGRSYEPVLLGDTPQGVTKQLQFEVTVHYQLTTTALGVFTGRYYATDANAAEQLGRGFVTRYIRPALITDVATTPIS
jgi:hypothetical protein